MTRGPFRPLDRLILVQVLGLINAVTRPCNNGLEPGRAGRFL